MNPPVPDISNQGAQYDMGCCSREPFFGTARGWLKVEVGSHISALMGFFPRLGSQIPFTELRGVWVHPPHCRGHGGSRSCKTPQKMWDEPQHLKPTSSLTSALLERSLGHLSNLLQVLPAPWLNSTSTNHFWGGGSLGLVLQTHFRVSTS